MLLRRILILILLLPIVAATCEQELSEITSEDVFEDYLKNNIFAFLANPDKSYVNFNELNATVKFYVSTGTIDISAICTAGADITEYGGINVTYVVKKFLKNPVRNLIPRCADGTPYGKCSSTQPRFCYSGNLEYMCSGPDLDAGTTEDNCGCPAGDEPCFDNGMCNVECYDKSQCVLENSSRYCDGQILKEKTCRNVCSANKCIPDPFDCTVRVIDTCSDCIDVGPGVSECASCSGPADCPDKIVKKCFDPYYYHNNTCSYDCNGGFCIQSTCTPDGSKPVSCSPGYCVTGTGEDTCGECRTESDCPPMAGPEFCIGDERHSGSCSHICSASNTCEVDSATCTSQIIENCSGGYFKKCKEDTETTSCVRCLENSDCDNSHSIVCLDGKVQNRTSIMNCVSNFCSLGGSDYSIVDDCNANAISECNSMCPGGAKCMPNYIPSNEFYVYSPVPFGTNGPVTYSPLTLPQSGIADYVLTITIIDRDDTNKFKNNTFTNLRFSVYNSSGSLIYTNETGTIGKCDYTDNCDFPYALNFAIGDYTFQWTLIVQSGVEWNLPSTLPTGAFPVPFKCENSLDVILQ